MTAPERFDWVWYGVDDNGESHISLGRWQKHPCQFRYKFADVQPTEHDRADTATWNAAIRAAADAATYVIQNIDILKPDGETYETPRVQKIARGLVDLARQDILALRKGDNHD